MDDEEIGSRQVDQSVQETKKPYPPTHTVPDEALVKSEAWYDKERRERFLDLVRLILKNK